MPGKVSHLHTGSTSLTVKQAIENARTYHANEPMRDVIIIGWDADGDLFISSSAMTRAEALFLADVGCRHARGDI